MRDYHDAIISHYRQSNLHKNVAAAYEARNLSQITHADTAGLDEFHIRGRMATRELATLAKIRKGMAVLDLGCGLGGPARTLAAEFGCRVVGVDIMEEYIRTAQMLTERVGLSDRISFLNRDMMAYPFDPDAFDVVWTLHTAMNIPDKETLFQNVFQAIKPGGCFALYEICAGAVSPVVFPVPWAGDGSINFLLKPEMFEQTLRAAGFIKQTWIDMSAICLEWFKKRIQDTADAKTKSSGKKSLKPGISLVMGRTTPEKMKNVVQNLAEDRIRVYYAVMKKPL